MQSKHKGKCSDERAHPIRQEQPTLSLHRRSLCVKNQNAEGSKHEWKCSDERTHHIRQEQSRTESPQRISMCEEPECYGEEKRHDETETGRRRDGDGTETETTPNETRREENGDGSDANTKGNVPMKEHILFARNNHTSSPRRRSPMCDEPECRQKMQT